jgi:tetratricopeptide (TPR) repeat protein
MGRRTTVVAVWVAAGMIAQAAVCGLACWQSEAMLARTTGNPRAEETALRHALSDAERNGPRVMVAVVSNQLALLLQRQGRAPEAEAAYLRSVKVLDNDRPASAPELARTLTNLGSTYYQQGRYELASATLSRAIATWKKVGGQPEPDFASALDNLGAALRAQARYSEAEPLYRQALAIREKEGADGEREKATVLCNLAVLQLDLARYDEAEEAARRALEIRRRLLPAGDAGLAVTFNLLGLIAEARGLNAEAVRQFRLALGTQNGDSLTTIQTLINMGGASRLAGDVTASRVALQRAIHLAEQEQPRHPLLATALNNLGLLEESAGHNQRARELFERAVTLWRETLGGNHPDYASGLTNLASLDRAHHPGKARELYLEALRIDEDRLGPSHPHVETDLNNAGLAAAAMHDDAAAEDYFRRALHAHSLRSTPQSAEEGFIMANLAAVYVRQHRSAEATDTYRRAILILRTTAGKDDPRMAGVLEAWSRFLRAAGSYAEAETAEVSATGIRVRNALRRE